VGKRGPLKDPSSDRSQRSHSKGKAETPGLVVLPGIKPKRTPPVPDSKWEPQVKKAWKTFWQSPLQQVVEECDLPAVVRYFSLYNLHERIFRAVNVAIAVTGSKGQPRANPLLKSLGEVQGQLLRLENELGLTPMSRARLGLINAQGRITAQQLNDMAKNNPAEAIQEAELVEDEELAQMLEQYEEAD